MINDDIQLSRKKTAFNKEQKVAFALFILIAVAGVGFGVKSLGVNIKRPFDIQLASYQGSEAFLLESEIEEEKTRQQKITDTDGDGIFDYDELFIYKTSPYLQDSDSDGFSDKQEIKSGNNPNCPSDQDCGTSLVTSVDDNVQITAGDIYDAPKVPDSLASLTTEIELDSVDDVRNFFSTLSVEQIKSLLIAQGIPAEALDILDEQDLSSLLDAAVEEAEAGGQFDKILEGAE